MHSQNFSFVQTWRDSRARTRDRRFSTTVTTHEDDICHLGIVSDCWPDEVDSAELTPGPTLGMPGRLRWGEGARLELRGSGRARWLKSERGRCFGVCGAAWMLRFTRRGDERYFGLGEKWGSLEKSGVSSVFYNTDVWARFDRSAVRRGECDPLYGSVPYLVIEMAGTFIGILIATAYPAFVKIPPRQDPSASLELGALGGAPSVYFLVGPTLEGLTCKLQRLVGTTPRPPLWALGHHQCRWGYRGEADLMRLDARFEQHQIPCDGLWLDIDYMRGFRVFTVARRELPRPQQTFSTLARRGRRVVAILDPGVKREPGFPLYDEGLAQGHFCVTPEGSPFVGLVWPGETVFPDFAKSATRDWWARQVASFAALGFSGFWLDMNEPATGDVDPTPLLFDGGKQSHQSYHNHYALGMAQASHAGLLSARPQERPFLLTRAFAPSISRYAGVWTGDNCSNETHLALSIPTTLNLALSGVPFNAPDVPGFGDDADADLIERWYKVAFLFPFLRNHSCTGTRSQEPWAFTKRTLAVVRHFVRWRYRLLPYLYGLFQRQEREGQAILRPLFYDFPDEPAAFGVDDQFMVGPALMQAPILRRAQPIRRVVLPRAEWFEAHSGRWRSGPVNLRVREPEAGTPLYVREATLLPMLEQLGRHTPGCMDAIELAIFLRSRSRQVAHLDYEFDDGISFGYRQGQLSRFSIQARVSGSDLLVEIEPLVQTAGSLHVKLVLFAKFAQVRVVVANRERRYRPRPARLRFTGEPLRVWKTPRFEVSLEA